MKLARKELSNNCKKTFYLKNDLSVKNKFCNDKYFACINTDFTFFYVKDDSIL